MKAPDIFVIIDADATPDNKYWNHLVLNSLFI